MHRQKLSSRVQPPFHDASIPGEDRHISDGVVIPGNVLGLRKPTIQHVQLSLALHRVPVNRVLHLDGRIGIEMPKSTAEERSAADLPEQP